MVYKYWGGYTAGICLAISIIFLCMHFRCLEKNKLLNMCGRHSLEIYVLHAFVQLVTREGLIMIGITDFYLNILINLVLEIVLCLSAAYILKKIHWYNFFFKPSTFLMKD